MVRLAIEPFVSVLKVRKPEERTAARRAREGIGVERMGASQKAWYWLAVLKGGNAQTRAVAGDALGQLGAPAVELLIAALKSRYPEFQVVVCELPAKLNDPRAVAPLIATLEDHDPNVREAASEALHKMGTVAVEPLMAVALKSHNPFACSSACQIPGEIRDPRAVETLIAGARNTGLHGNVRTAAFMALSRFEDPRAIVSLIAALHPRGDLKIVPQLVRLPQTHSSKRLAEDYRNCGQADRGKAARAFRRPLTAP